MKRLLLSAFVIFSIGCNQQDTPDSSNGPLSPSLQQGQKVVESTCIACHGQGLNGAPILGNKKMWAKRLPQGEDTLVEHAISGFAYDMMPAKGGNPDLSDQDVRFAVQYMMSLVQ